MHIDLPASLDAVLREVSRSFYLSIRLLPPHLRAPVGTAYLLARATDTVADAPDLPAQRRLELLARLGRAIHDASPDPELARDAAALADGHPHAGEARLLGRVSGCLAALQALGPEDRSDVRTVLAHIVRGQSLDLARFDGAAPVAALQDAGELSEYTYLVAGSVGEFWTALCARHVPGFADRSTGEMMRLGRTFGCGLQLVNIVRDAGADLRAGRCYFPADELRAAGLEPGDILERSAAFEPVRRKWMAAAQRQLEDGLAYALAVRPARLRAAVALPAILGRRTLDRVQATGDAALHVSAKVPRAEVRRLLLRLALGLAGRRTVQREWDNRAG